MKILKALGLAAIIGASATASQAAVIGYATSVDSYTQGANTNTSGVIAPGRLNVANALGGPDGNFLSLGLGGEVVFSFANKFKSIVGIFEFTPGDRSLYIEAVEVFAGLGGVFKSFGIVTSEVALNEIILGGGKYDQLKLVDKSPVRRFRDGFDVDAVYVTLVPVPASGLLLLTTIGGLSLLRRRKA